MLVHSRAGTGTRPEGHLKATLGGNRYIDLAGDSLCLDRLQYRPRNVNCLDFFPLHEWPCKQIYKHLHCRFGKCIKECVKQFAEINGPGRIKAMLSAKVPRSLDCESDISFLP